MNGTSPIPVMKSRFAFIYPTLATVAFGLAAGTAHATFVVNLEPSASWVTTDGGATAWTATTGDYDSDGTADDIRLTQAFSTTTAFSPVGGNYTSAQSSVFYGGGSITAYNNTTLSAATQLRNKQINTSTDQYDVVSFGTASTANTATIAVLWKKEDFLGTGDVTGNSVNLTSDTALSFSAYTPSSTFYYQWLVQIGTTFYVSESITAISEPQASGNTPIVSTDLTTTRWATIDLKTDILSPIGSYTTLDLENIQAVGVYFTSTGSSANKRLFLGSFSADATITSIPEPSALALLAGASAFGLVAARRRR